MSHTIESIAAMVPPREAQLAVAKVLAALGGSWDWNADTTSSINAAVTDIAQSLPGIPSITDQNAEAVEFWQNLP